MGPVDDIVKALGTALVVGPPVAKDYDFISVKSGGDDAPPREHTLYGLFLAFYHGETLPEKVVLSETKFYSKLTALCAMTRSSGARQQQWTDPRDGRVR